MGLALGIIFSTSTIITAPLFLPYGIMDMLIAAISEGAVILFTEP
ncbi:MAG: hypothetical protein AOA65_0903 [Candidatus Bathyarchaeota archaeon BA1]|nr:MAG: hypothetical protein AOA65_0903 [Candidatus Bathyarchaeota archaeon BA1]